MRGLQWMLALLVAFVACASAWTPEDHEIFRLRDELIASEGANVTFYSFLGVAPSASQEDIVKAHRARSRKMHPDKLVPTIIARREAPAKGDKGAKKGLSQKEKRAIERDATVRYARLQPVVEILKGPARVRYDHFLRNGFPIWRGTGYYYSRFRPGLASVLAGLFLVFGGAVHYGALYIGWKRHHDFVERYVAHARRTAWGNDSGIPGLDSLNGTGAVATPPPPPELEQDEGGAVALNRRQKRMQEKESKKKDTAKALKSARRSGISRPVESEPLGQAATGARKKVVAENGKVLIVDVEGNVFLEEQTDDGEIRELLVDPDEIEKPTIFHTAVFRVPVWIYSRTVGRALGSMSGVSANEQILENADIMVNDPSQHEQEVLDKATSINANAETRKRKTKAKK